MAKFFLEETRKKKSKDYRIISYRKMLQLLKSYRQRRINSVVKKLKSTSSPQTTNLLEKQLSQLKSNKNQLHSLTLAVLDEIGIKKPQKFIEKMKLNSSQQISQYTTQIKAKFLQSDLGKNAVSQLLALASSITNKKLQKRQKIKQRKQRKLSDNARQRQPVIEQEVNVQQNQSFQPRQQQQQVQKNTNNFKTKPISKERTEFKKTGRNKFLKQKKLSKRQTQNQKRQARKPESGRKKYENMPKMRQTTFSMHPSWSAKKEARQTMFIQPFQGKKITL